MWSVVRPLLVVLLLPLAAGDPIVVPTSPDDLDLPFEQRDQDILDSYDFRLFSVHLQPELSVAPADHLVDPLHTPWGLLGLPVPEGVLLNWNEPLAGPPDAYRIYRSVDDGPMEFLAEVPGSVHLDTTAWQENATVLAYSVTAVYTAGGVSKESPPSNVFLMPGPLGDCSVLWVREPEDPSFLPVDYGVNESYAECLQSGGQRTQDPGTE